MDMQSVKDGWNMYSAGAVRSDKGSEEYHSARTAFYSGASIVVALFDEASHRPTLEERAGFVKSIREELDAFLVEMVLRVAVGPFIRGGK
ncbi:MULTISPECIES: hypothetical protein [Caballeronia]|uniref:hypothetical protein n=1 Tax=Caballeronia TaxID=1827195 RepID=UPI00025BA5CF|nr:MULTISPECIES: hypothetical protein [Caballeronia]EKS67885.1 hypothetical protein BURK_022675 [Burkholderia sp. SJ98]